MTAAAERSCPVCGTSAAAAKLFLEENIDSARLSTFSFASRKQPEFMCHRLVQCRACDLVYVPQPPGQDELAAAYHSADYDSSEEGNDAAAAYLKAIGPVLDKLPRRGRALEIGTGTAVFLELLKDSGFDEVVGVEPSTAAIAAAPAHRRGWIREGIFDEADFEPASFDLICCFMTMEHVADPGQIAASAMRLLRPGGAFVTVTHDWRSAVNRLLGRRSPIIDIEHMQLFSERSIGTLFRRGGYRDVTVRKFANLYALRYWLRLTPLPHALKAGLAETLGRLGLADRKLAFNVGNSIAAGFRPSPGPG